MRTKNEQSMDRTPISVNEALDEALKYLSENQMGAEAPNHLESFPRYLAEAMVVGVSRYLEANNVDMETKEIVAMLKKSCMMLLGPKKSLLMQKLRVFDRVGADQIQRRYRKGL